MQDIETQCKFDPVKFLVFDYPAAGIILGLISTFVFIAFIIYLSQSECLNSPHPRRYQKVPALCQEYVDGQWVNTELLRELNNENDGFVYNERKK